MLYFIGWLKHEIKQLLFSHSINNFISHYIFNTVLVCFKLCNDYIYWIKTPVQDYTLWIVSLQGIMNLFEVLVTKITPHNWNFI